MGRRLLMHPINSLGFICLLLIQCAPIQKNIISNDDQIWENVESADGSQPIKRHEAAFVGLGSKLYLLGGRGMKPTSIYDTKSKKWTVGAVPPIELHHFQPTVYEGKVYVIGALTGAYPAETPTENIYIYDPSNDRWEIGAVIPEHRRRGGAGISQHKGIIYFVCGIKNGHIGDHKNWLDSYDPRSDRWTELADAPRARDHFQSAIIDGKLYAAGGRLSNAPENVFNLTIGEVDVYDIPSNTWTTIADTLPTHRAGSMTIAYKDQLIVAGGESSFQEAAHAEVEALNTLTYKWHSMPPLNQGRHGSGLVHMNDGIYVASGCGNRGGNPELLSMERLTH